MGLLSGMFGVGGGFLTTPLLIVYGIPPTVAAASAASQVTGASVWRLGALAARRGGREDGRRAGRGRRGGLVRGCVDLPSAPGERTDRYGHRHRLCADAGVDRVGHGARSGQRDPGAAARPPAKGGTAAASSAGRGTALPHPLLCLGPVYLAARPADAGLLHRHPDHLAGRGRRIHPGARDDLHPGHGDQRRARDLAVPDLVRHRRRDDGPCDDHQGGRYRAGRTAFAGVGDGAQVGAKLATNAKPEYLRLALAVIVLLVGLRILLGLVWRPEEIFTVQPL